MRFRYAHAAHPDWTVATEECLLLLKRFAGDERYVRNPNLGILYLTDALAGHADQILTTLKARTGIANWVGAAGAGVCATGAEYLEEPAMAVMLAHFPAGSFNVFSGTQRPPARGLKDGGAERAFTALVHADPHANDLPELVQDMARKVESGYVFGGVSSGRLKTLQIADRILSGGISGVVFGSDVKLVSRLSQGCYPLPGVQRRRVTKAAGNTVVELDGRRAFDVLLEDAGIRPREASTLHADGTPELNNKRRAEELAQLQALGRRGLFVGLETQSTDSGAVYREVTPRAAYVVRHILSLDPAQGTIGVVTPIEEGQRLRFCTRDESTARKDMIRMCSEVRDHLHEQAEAAHQDIHPQDGSVHSQAEPLRAKGAIYISCLGRGAHMFGEQGEELRLLQAQLGNVPVVGLYANGEIAGQNLYAYTGVLTVFY